MKVSILSDNYMIVPPGVRIETDQPEEISIPEERLPGPSTGKVFVEIKKAEISMCRWPQGPKTKSNDQTKAGHLMTALEAQEAERVNTDPHRRNIDLAKTEAPMVAPISKKTGPVKFTAENQDQAAKGPIDAMQDVMSAYYMQMARLQDFYRFKQAVDVMEKVKYNPKPEKDVWPEWAKNRLVELGMIVVKDGYVYITKTGFDLLEKGII